MTRKDYVLIASTFAKELSCYKDLTTEAQAIRELARRMATELENTNPRFNRDLFLEACVVRGVK